ncbi:uracil phosphoribosyltransferase [Chondrinema litorale]|uniref:uracil phosphoribosyltransferase n=1 Tax=Chondrinema litorale TaxID=2994555 RepID=UPI0025447F70|nr:uracil phosphoribosyltransferase [Chondrinema litorale]UZR95588.1 uracil phosphoribosyltransferase [Chondrinema litorale]
MVYIFNDHSSVANHAIAEMRDIDIQQDRSKFRTNLKKLGWFMAYELSKKLNFTKKEIKTPLGSSEISLINEEIVLATILRAGLPFYQGFIEVFDKAQSAFIGAYRAESENEGEEIYINMEYMASPSVEDKTLIIIDPMLATGKSLIKSYESLIQRGKPHCIHLVAAIASKPGVEYVKQKLPNSNIWLGALDDTLNKQSYIVPGLGDAGDLSFGEKI